MNSKMIPLFNLMLVSILLSGCGMGKKSFNQRTFVLEANRSQPPQKNSKEITLSVESFTTDTAYSTKNLIYRKGQLEYETDFYNRLLIRPDDMITEKTRAWLSESGLFKLVLEPGTYTKATHILEGNIIAMYGDFREESSPKARMKIRFFLVKMSDISVVFTNTYEATSEFKDRTAESLIEAFGVCLTNILSDLEKTLQQQL